MVGLKRDVAQFVYSCMICQKSKIEHQKPAGLFTPLDVPEWKVGQYFYGFRDEFAEYSEWF